MYLILFTIFLFIEFFEESMFSSISLRASVCLLSDFREVGNVQVSMYTYFYVPLDLVYYYEDFQDVHSLHLAFSDFYAIDFLMSFQFTEKLWAHLGGGFLSYAFETYLSGGSGTLLWISFAVMTLESLHCYVEGGGSSYFLVVNFEFLTSRWLFCFSILIK